MTLETDLLAVYDEQMRGLGRPPQPGQVIERDGAAWRTGGRKPHGLVNGPRDLGVTGAGLDALIARQQAYFAARGESVEWKTRGHDLPADIPARLIAAGFTAEEPYTVLVGRTADLAASPVVPPGVTLRRITTDLADFRALGALQSAVWGNEWDFIGDEIYQRTQADPDSHAVFTVIDDTAGTVVSTALVAFHPGACYGYLAAGSTLAQWRRRGIYRALVAARAQVAADRGIDYLTADASSASAPILTRLGLHPVTTTTTFIWQPPALQQPRA